MKILYAASEAVPFCKTGGLADVAGSLPEALAAQGAEVAVVLPLYQKVRERFGSQLTFECYDYVDLAWRHSYCGLFSLEKDGVTWYFLDNEQYFNRPELYGYMDDGERFGFFSRAVVRMLPHFRFWPDVLHCNDWQTALVPIYLKDDGVREERFRRIRTVLSIHNIEYQGRYGRQTLGDLFGLDHGWADDGTILMDGDVNLLKGAILCADAVNAVSPTYANELKMPYFAHRLDGIMRRCGYKLSGVLNGIDVKRYDPATDSHIAANYTAEDMAGKQADKKSLAVVAEPEERNEAYKALTGSFEIPYEDWSMWNEKIDTVSSKQSKNSVVGNIIGRRAAKELRVDDIVNIGRSQQMGKQIFVRVDSLLPVLKFQPREPQCVNLILLGRRKIAFDIYKRSAAFKLGQNVFIADIRQNPRQLFRGFIGIQNFFRIGIKINRWQRRGDDCAVAVNNIRTFNRILGQGVKTVVIISRGNLNFFAAGSADTHQPHRNNSVNQTEHQHGKQNSVFACGKRIFFANIIIERKTFIYFYFFPRKIKVFRFPGKPLSEHSTLLPCFFNAEHAPLS